MLASHRPQANQDEMTPGESAGKHLFYVAMLASDFNLSVIGLRS
jgi:hypothetical protein